MTNDSREATPKVTVCGSDMVLLENAQLRQNILPLGPPLNGKTTLTIQFPVCDVEKRSTQGILGIDSLSRLPVEICGSGLRVVKIPID